jgi:membrane protein YqaA with SNARE-associated domain
MSESVQTLEHQHHAVEAEREGLFVHLGRRRIRLEFLLLAGMFIIALVFGALFVALDLGKDDVERWGYAGLFGIVLFRSASVVMPMPGGGIIFAAGGLLDPVGGIPAPVAVGFVAGFAESLGELTGYAAGLAGSGMLRDRAIYRRVKAWIERRAFVTVFAMTLTPAPLFDIAGIAAGATRVPIRIFYPALLIGKVLRDTAVAAAGYYSFVLIEDWHGGIWNAMTSAVNSVGEIL